MTIREENGQIRSVGRPVHKRSPDGSNAGKENAQNAKNCKHRETNVMKSAGPNVGTLGARGTTGRDSFRAGRRYSGFVLFALSSAVDCCDCGASQIADSTMGRNRKSY